uniref:Uncharacterized protein n=1 Tax=Anguilla anguilla TaxID=7936 RepID=A0A0E9PZ74_ANGAN
MFFWFDKTSPPKSRVMPAHQLTSSSESNLCPHINS